MIRYLACMIALIGGSSASTAIAGDAWHALFGIHHQRVDCIGIWCCDDYCPKKAPCTHVCLGFCCDDYCPKKEPCTHICLGCCCDDYCKKCPPKVCTRPVCGVTGCGSTCRTNACCDGGGCDDPCDRCAMSDLGMDDNAVATNISVDPKDWMEIVGADPAESSEFPPVRVSTAPTTLAE